MSGWDKNGWYEATGNRGKSRLGLERTQTPQMSTRLVNPDWAMRNDELICQPCRKPMELMVREIYNGRRVEKIWTCMACNVHWVGQLTVHLIEELP